MADLRPRGRPDSTAVTWCGHTWTYRDLESLIDDAPRAPLVDISGMTMPRALACLFAAARAGTAVVVHDPALPAPPRCPLPDGTWLVAATSGSTGAPRAVCRSAASWSASAEPLATLAGLTPADRILVTGPMHSTLHLHAAVHTLAIGAHLTDVADSATAVHCVPAVLRTLADTLPPDAPLRTVIVAGAALPERASARALARGWSVTEYYGAAELSFVAARRLPDPVLTPFPQVALRVDAAGVLWSRSPYLADGYVTPAGFGPLRRDADGFATVGDVVAAGDRIADGFTVRGRGPDVIITGGFTVLAGDVESALDAIDGVRAAAVFGEPHERLGQIVTAALELEPDADLVAVRAAARRSLPSSSRPRRYLVVESLPRTSAGKVARDRLPTLPATGGRC